MQVCFALNLVQFHSEDFTMKLLMLLIWVKKCECLAEAFFMLLSEVHSIFLVHM
jgi:hypothetical protein